MPSALLTIGELSARSGIAPSALRFYEARGLITSLRTAGNQRRYQRAMLRRIGFIRSAQRVGLSLERLRAKLDGCIGCGCLSLKTCALNNPDDEAAERGAGAVFLEPGA
jgi:MerR family redox-sensitive transcriptional activator SoxR